MSTSCINSLRSSVLALLLPVFAASNAGALPAFPGAEGFGAESVGGRGGEVLWVTNLDDSGPGSLRAAVEVGGARYVVFNVSGIINLESDLRISAPYITIAGQTSPGGIVVAGYSFVINTHDVIIQHMRFRVGSHQVANGADAETLDSLVVLGEYWASNPAHDIIIDHCSVSWGVDECMSITGGVTNATVQWSIISEGLNDAGHPESLHSMGLLVSGKYVYDNSVSLHHNYFAHNRHRSPQMSSPDDVSVVVDGVNNVSYDWYGGTAPQGTGAAHINWVHNYARQGPESNDYSFEFTYSDNGTPQSPILYVHGNLGSTRLTQSEPHWNVGVSWRNEPLDPGWSRSEPWPAPAVATTVMSNEYAETILADVGATRPERDGVDARVVQDFFDGTGGMLTNVAYPDDYPVFPSAAPPPDTDSDGMSDPWEVCMFGDLSREENGDHDADGYTNIEEYFHYLAGGGSPTEGCNPTDDGGAPDAGDAGIDAGTDAGADPGVDAGFDAGVDSGMDQDEPSNDDGCACSGQRSGAVSLLWLFGLVAAMALRRRRSG